MGIGTSRLLNRANVGSRDSYAGKEACVRVDVGLFVLRAMVLIGAEALA